MRSIFLAVVTGICMVQQSSASAQSSNKTVSDSIFNSLLDKFSANQLTYKEIENKKPVITTWEYDVLKKLVTTKVSVAKTTGNTKPANGTYLYKVAFEEWERRTLSSTCIVVIKGDSVTVFNNGTLTGTKGEIIDEGIIAKHKSGQWIISQSPADVKVPTDDLSIEGPSVIDFGKKPG